MKKTKSRLRVVFDTNVLISALLYGGVPDQILELAESHTILGITSSALLKELNAVLGQKFRFTLSEVELLTITIYRTFSTVHTSRSLKIVKDEPDNRILEAALAGKAHFIITGDKELLTLKKFRSIKIVTPRQFLTEISPLNFSTSAHESLIL